MSPINLNLLKKLKAASESKSFSAAATKLGTSLGTLASQMEDLEKELGIKIFLRKGKKKTTILTERGKEIYERYNYLEESLDLRTDVGQIDSIKKFKIKLKTTPGLSALIVPGLQKYLTEFKAPYLLTVNSLCQDNFISGDEILIRADILQMEDNAISLLFNLEFSFFCSEGYIQNKKMPKNLEDLYDHSILSPDLIFNYESFKKVVPKLGINVNSNPSLISNDVSTLLTCCKLGLGITELPTGYPGTEELVRIHLEDYDLRRNIYFSYNKSAYNRKEFMDFLTLFEQFFKEEFFLKSQ